ncbi:MAG TPA: sulfotransferase [Burkholderiaceae bacterium]
MSSAAAQKAAQRIEAAEFRERLRGLTPEQADTLRRALQLQAGGDKLLAGQWLLAVSRQAPDHPEVLRWLAVQHAERLEWAAAVTCLRRAVEQRPNDFKLLLPLGTAQELAGDAAAALVSLRAAARSAREAAEWRALSLEFDRQGHYEDSLAAIEQQLRLEPNSVVGLLQRSRCFKALGDAERAAADARLLIARKQEAARAWFSLVDLKIVPLGEAELAQLAQAAGNASTPADERLLLDFALGKALEDAGRFDEALAVFQRANAAARPSHPWDGPGFTQHVAAVHAAFAERPAARAQAQGAELIFLVGLPRSGSTLVEQVLASHSRVEGASELPYLNQVIEAESQRRGQRFPAWVPDASSEDWTRLGQHYLRLSQRWRAQRPVSTDKLPENWLYAGALLAMLPEARIIDCRRDAVETCWSCYKQLFGPGRVGFTYSFDTLAGYWRAYLSLSALCAAQRPERFRVQHYEALVAEPEAQIRALLEFCGLPFEPQCLSFQTAQRAIRTPSALQVRQPMRATSTPAQRYGAALDELRQALARD